MKFYVYVYRDPSRNNEPIYVGKGFGNRAYEHLDSGSHSVLVNRRLAKMKRNGIEPIINVIDMPSEALAVQCEIDTIARFGRKDLKLGPLLNQTDGGEGVSNPSAATRQKISAAHKGKILTNSHRQKISDNQKGDKNHNFGKPKTDKIRSKMSAKALNRPRIICPHCGKEGATQQLKQWHFDNCKYRK
jgi:hypothetical protein